MVAEKGRICPFTPPERHGGATLSGSRRCNLRPLQNPLLMGSAELC